MPNKVCAIPAIPTKESSTKNLHHNEGVIRRIFNGHFRFVMLALSTVCLTLGMCNAMALHFTVICMPKNGTDTTAKEANADSDGFFTFAQEGWLFSALAFGTLVGSVPLVKLCNWLGFRRVFTLYGMLGACGTVVVPFVIVHVPAPFNFVGMLGIRILEGLILAISYVAMERISTNWSPLNEATLFMGIISCHFQLGRVVSMIMSGMLCESAVGWPSVYYILGGLTIAAFALFFCAFRTRAANHSWVSQTELSKINENRNTTTSVDNDTTQRRNSALNTFYNMFTDPHTIALFVSGFGIVLGQQMFTQYGPTYYKIARGVGTRTTGFLTGFPYLCSAITATLVGRLCDRWAYLRTRGHMAVVFLSAGSQCMMALSFMSLSMLPKWTPVWMVHICFTISVVFNGLWVLGMVKNVKLIPKQPTYVLSSTNTAILYFYVMIMPYLVNLFIQNAASDLAKWNTMFMMIAAVQVFCASLTVVSALKISSSKPQEA